MIDAAFSPFGTTLVYTAATSRIVYGMSLNHHLPKIFLKTNRHQIPYVTLYANLLVGALSFLPFPGWQKLVAFLSSASILSYAIGPICLLAMRKLQPETPRPFHLIFANFFSYTSFYLCNLMLYWCGYSIIWKLDVALLIGFAIQLTYHRKSLFSCDRILYWFVFYMASLTLVSYFGSFGGKGKLIFPFDMICLLPLSLLVLFLSNILLNQSNHKHITSDDEA
jgi:amino acid transporter